MTDTSAYEVTCSHRLTQKQSIQLREKQVEFERRSMEIRLQVLKKDQEGSEREREMRIGLATQEQQSHEREREQRMHLARESASMGQVSARVHQQSCPSS